MEGTKPETRSPIEGMNCSFADYAAKRKAMLTAHMSGNGLPDYAYSMDYEYRKKLDAVPGLFKTLKRTLSPAIQESYHEYLRKGVKASPAQFGEIYRMGCDCAKALGIGIPTIVVCGKIRVGNTYDEMNAVSYCVDDQEPLIVVTSLMVERMTPGELKAVIGHECGHTHNNHGIYQTAASILANLGVGGLAIMPGYRTLARIASMGVDMLLQMWGRAAEVTADRAAMVCASPEDAYGAEKKLLYGGAHIGGTVDTDLNVEELRKQLDAMNGSFYRLGELSANHPAGARRLFAEMAFSECETLYSWRPDLKKPGRTLRSKSETDEICRNILSVMKGKERRK